MGEVYEAEHLRLGRRVAVKVLRSGSDQRGIDRFWREKRAVASLESEHVVNVFDCGTLRDGTPYLVMALLRGQDLRALLSNVGPLPVARAVRIVQQAARGVSAAHRAGIVHRDLKPENLFLVRRDGGRELCKVLDFGVAKTATSELTQQGAVVGTIKYMAPEQLEDSTRVGPTTDIYALGAILYECLTGTTPHDAPTAQEIMLKILVEPVRPVRNLRGDVPEALAALVSRALARNPKDRYQSSDEFEAALEPFVHVPGVPSDLDDSRTGELSIEKPPRAAVNATPPADAPTSSGERRSYRPGERSAKAVEAREAAASGWGRFSSKARFIGAVVALLVASVGAGAFAMWLWLGGQHGARGSANAIAVTDTPGPSLAATDALTTPSDAPVTPTVAAVPAEPADRPSLEGFDVPEGKPNAVTPAPEPSPAASKPARPTRSSERSERAHSVAGKPQAAEPTPKQAPAPPSKEASPGMPSLRLERENPYGS